MRRVSGLVAVAAVVAAVLLPLGLASWASGQVFTFDENGVGAFGAGAPMPDPGPGGLGGALTYPLGFAATVGDVVMTEPPAFDQTSDIIRWNGNNTLVFYSDIFDGVNSLADI